jgi:hypothetical protein
MLSVALVVAGRQEVIAQLQTYSLDTLQSDPSFLEAATQSTMRVAPHLGLTEQQAYAIATGAQCISMSWRVLSICCRLLHACLKGAWVASPAACVLMLLRQASMQRC